MRVKRLLCKSEGQHTALGKDVAINFRQFTILFPKKSLQKCFIEMCAGAMWTSQILVKTQLHRNQGLDGSGLVRRAIPIGRRQVTQHKFETVRHFRNLTFQNQEMTASAQQ